MNPEAFQSEDLARSEQAAAEARRSQRRIEVMGASSRAIAVGRSRLAMSLLLFAAAFLVVVGKLVSVTLLAPAGEPRVTAAATTPRTMGRADIVDRNGIILATSLPVRSLYADPMRVLDPVAAARDLARVLPDLDRAEVLEDLRKPSRFVWLKRSLSPRQQAAVNRLGIPGVGFLRDERRVYPHGALAAHVVGFTDIDSQGLAGIEHSFDDRLRQDPATPLRLSLDLRVQHLVHAELARAVRKFAAIGGSALVLDVRNGETVAMVSLPDFDPNALDEAPEDNRFNRNTLGVYEMGSTFKAFTIAMALDAGVVSIGDGYDATEPMRVSRYLVRDFHPEERWLSVPEILLYSSNIGAAKMALDVGAERQQAFLDSLGMMQPPPVELPEAGHPMLPPKWREVNVVTAAYGHGIAVTPLHLAAGIAATVNGGVLHPSTLIKRSSEDPVPGRRVISSETSALMRALLRLVVVKGTGKQADAPGYLVGGKTGTAEKTVNGRYVRNALVSSFVGTFPIDAPRYVVFVMLDEPKGIEETHGFATGGWTAAPTVGAIVGHIAPMLGVTPRTPDVESERSLLVHVRDVDAPH